MDFTQATNTFTNFRVLHTPMGSVPNTAAGPADVYPAFLPTNGGLVFETEVGTTAGNMARPRAACKASSGGSISRR